MRFSAIHGFHRCAKLLILARPQPVSISASNTTSIRFRALNVFGQPVKGVRVAVSGAVSTGNQDGKFGAWDKTEPRAQAMQWNPTFTDVQSTFDAGECKTLYAAGLASLPG